MDLRHPDPRMTRGDHDLRVMPPGPQAPQMPPVGGMGMGMPPVMQQQPNVRPNQSIPETDP